MYSGSYLELRKLFDHEFGEHAKFRGLVQWTRPQRARLLTSELLITGSKILQEELALLQGKIKTSKSLHEAILPTRRSMTSETIVFAQRTN